MAMLSQSTSDVAYAKVAHAWFSHALNVINQCTHQQTHLSRRGNMFLDVPSTDAVRVSYYIFLERLVDSSYLSYDAVFAQTLLLLLTVMATFNGI